jgi:sarcosine oxidase gamma subunit
MTTASRVLTQDVRVTVAVPQGVYEFVAFPSEPPPACLPATPGGVTGDGAATACLHFAPARWLLVDPGEALLAELQHPTGALFEVDGKWHRVTLTGPGSRRLIAHSLDVDAMLSDRDCAATTVFDCPAVIAAAAGGLDVWVSSSYAVELVARLETLCSRGPEGSG